MLQTLLSMVRVVALSLAHALGLGPEHDFFLKEKYSRVREFYGPRVLDFGAGSCRFASYLSRRGHQVTAVDVVDASKVPGCRPLICSAPPLPFPDDHFDTVISMFVLHHIQDCEPVIRELRRVTRNYLIVAEDLCEGWWDRVFTALHNGSSGWGKARESYRSREEWLRLFQSFGLRPCSTLEIPRHRTPYYPVRRGILVLEKHSPDERPSGVL
ncbi:MAG: class I SAM-dependent methyltransferase [Armatimonadetes bacterium]|nr:class I SAM-dependent methyltransferase [Armatimonadota bacterium]